MSDLKYQTPEQLEKSKLQTESRITNLETEINGQKVRLEWINKYLFEKTPQELTIEQIEQRLGHKVIIR